MLTIFTTTKPFRGHSGVIQRNALRSWSRLQPKCQIILLGADEGVEEAALEVGALHIREVECTDRGIPLVNSLFELAQAHAVHSWVCFANADIVLMQDFVLAVRAVRQSKRIALIVGRRWNLNIEEPINVDAPDWAGKLREDARLRGELFAQDALDYFAFPRGFYRDIPPMAVGREGWDNWMIYAARRKLAPVVDVTASVMAIHQNHDYGKFKNVEERRASDETLRNQSYVGVGFFDLRDSTHDLVDGRVRRTWNRNLRWHVWRAALLFPALARVLTPLSRLKTMVLNAVGR